jgi:hypothetical protein
VVDERLLANTTHGHVPMQTASISGSTTKSCQLDAMFGTPSFSAATLDDSGLLFTTAPFFQQIKQIN